MTALLCLLAFLLGARWAGQGMTGLRLRIAMLNHCVTMLADELQERAVFRRRVEDGLVLTDAESAEVWRSCNDR